MASTLPECVTPVRMLLAAVFILLSANAVAQEKRCYWCGPLAEQVHRSRRAPPCEPFEQQQTVCDEGYKHCAIVATSPPYTESRLCVKFYQDECYSLYCNSTRTWRMVCPCRGNLCNGKNTDREINAFVSLNKIVTKAITRNKRDVVKGFLNIRTKARDNISTEYDKKLPTTIDTQSSEQQPIELILQNTTVVNNYSNQYNDDTIIEHGSTDSITKNNYDGVSVISTTVATTAETKKMTQTTTQMDMKLPKTEMPATMKPTTIQVVLAVDNKDNKKDNIPPIEALQHNVTPKVTEHTTMATIEVSTNDNIIVTTESSNVHKNLATRIIMNIVTIVLISFALINIY